MSDVSRQRSEYQRFTAHLAKLSRNEIEQLIFGKLHWSNVVSNFDIANGTAGTAIYDEITRRARAQYIAEIEATLHGIIRAGRSKVEQ